MTGMAKRWRAGLKFAARAQQSGIVIPPMRKAMDAVSSVDFAEICITSSISVKAGEGPATAFRAEDSKSIAVVFHKAEGPKCARSWKISKDIGTDKDFPDITPRDAAAVREWMHRFGKTI